MKLELDDRPTIDDPSAETLEAALRGLRVPECTFAILERQAGHYIQAAKNEDGSFVLEYQDGSIASHLELSYFVMIEDVVEAFRSYLAQDGVWRHQFQWKLAAVPGSGL